MLNSIPEPVDPVGNAFRYVCCALKLALELGHPPGAPSTTCASSRLGRTCAPTGLAIDARPVGSCAASASTGAIGINRRRASERPQRGEEIVWWMMSIEFMSESIGRPKPIRPACWIALAAFWLSDRLHIPVKQLLDSRNGCMELPEVTRLELPSRSRFRGA